MSAAGDRTTDWLRTRPGRIVLVGAFGFIGSAFKRRLERDGVPFECATRIDPARPGDPVSVVIDCAGNASKVLAARDPDADRRANVDAVRERIEALRPEHYVHLSSSAVYADVSSPEATAPVDEPDGDVGPYGAHKREAERIVRAGVPTPLVLRPAGLFGPGLAKGPVYDLLEGLRPWVAPTSRMQLVDVDAFAARALALIREGGTFNAVPDAATCLETALPGEAAAQTRLASGDALPELDFAIAASAFADDGGTRRFRAFAQDYVRCESRAEVRVFLLAGGRGTRLGGDVPKPAVDVGGRALAACVLDPFVRAGYDRFYALLGHGAEDVLAALEAGLGRRHVDRFVESEPIGTGGAVLAALARTPKPHALVVNGDTLYDGFDPERLVKHHVRAGAIATLLVSPVDDASESGRVAVAPDGRVTAFDEKAHDGRGLVYAGCIAIDRERFVERLGGTFGPPRAASLERELLPALIASGDLHAHVVPDLRFIDAGTPDRLTLARAFVAERDARERGA